MTMGEIQERVMFQTANDVDDLGDFQPHVDGYINAGYDELYFAFHGNHPEVLLNTDTDVPDLPSWLHIALADYATWMVYRNGNTVKQQRGMTFLSAFTEAKRRIGLVGGRVQFVNHLNA